MQLGILSRSPISTSSDPLASGKYFPLQGSAGNGFVSLGWNWEGNIACTGNERENICIGWCGLELIILSMWEGSRKEI